MHARTSLRKSICLRWLNTAPAVTKRLAGKTAIVTGAGQGLGAAIARKFSLHGANVIVADWDISKATSTASNMPGPLHSAMPFRVDVTDETAVANCVDFAVATYGGIDIVVANAGHQYIAPIEDMPYAEWKKMLAVHMDGCFLLTRAAIRKMKEKRTQNGKIILMGSVHSKEASVLKSPYVAAKHGILGFSRAVAKEAGPLGISCNVICPGFVRTPLVDAQIPQQAKNLNISEEEVISRVMLGNTVDKLFTTDDDVAEATLFFAAHPTNALTGQSLNVSHGWRMD